LIFARRRRKLAEMNNFNNDKNSIIPKDDAETIFKPYFQDLSEIINGAWTAWEEFQKVAPDLWMPLRARTRANFIYDHIVHRATEKFDNQESKSKGIGLEEKRGFLLIHIANKLTIRFKKFRGKKWQVSNVQTMQQVLFSLQLDIPGLPKSTRVVVGYKLNELQTAIDQLAITCRSGEQLEWVIEIPDASAGNVISITPQTPVAPTPADVVAQNVKPKAKKEKKDKDQ
jgi:hypothetical protein